MQQVVKNIWEKYDADRSGMLDRQEVKEFLKEMFGYNKSMYGLDDHLLDFFKEVDFDNNDAISKQEMVQFLQAQL